VPQNQDRLLRKTQGHLEASKKLLEEAEKTLSEVRALSKLYELPKVKPPNHKRAKPKKAK
jgi:hypothetical protein